MEVQGWLKYAGPWLWRALLACQYLELASFLDWEQVEVLRWGSDVGQFG